MAAALERSKRHPDKGRTDALRPILEALFGEKVPD